VTTATCEATRAPGCGLRGYGAKSSGPRTVTIRHGMRGRAAVISRGCATMDDYGRFRRNESDRAGRPRSEAERDVYALVAILAEAVDRHDHAGPWTRFARRWLPCGRYRAHGRHAAARTRAWVR